MTTNSPLAAMNTGMAELGTGNVLLLNTGYYPAFSNIYNGVAKWNGTNWSSGTGAILDTTAPAPRYSASIAYDGYNLFVYGGKSGTTSIGLYSDCFTYSGTTWTKFAGTTPFGRWGATAARTSSTSINVAIVSGGKQDGGLLEEIWIWNGNTQTFTLTTQTVSFPARIGHVVCGGASETLFGFGSISSGECVNDVYSMNLGTFQIVKLAMTNTPSVRTGCVMCYDQANSNYVMFGGMNEYNYLPETWTFNSGTTTWTKQSPVFSPPALVNAMMCYDSQSGAVIMYGGQRSDTGLPSNNTYSWSGTNWSKL